LERDLRGIVGVAGIHALASEKAALTIPTLVVAPHVSSAVRLSSMAPGRSPECEASRRADGTRGKIEPVAASSARLSVPSGILVPSMFVVENAAAETGSFLLWWRRGGLW